MTSSSDPRHEHRETLIRTAAAALSRSSFNAVAVSGRAEALERILAVIDPRASVGYGGSQTLQQLELVELLARRGQKLFAQTPSMSREEVIEVRRQSLMADVFLGSPNAVTCRGELIFVDKIGNRAAGMMFGPRTVIAVAGANKIVADETAGYARIALNAGPVNARRLKLKTPCVEQGICVDCNSPDRICNIAVTLRKKPAYTEYYVFLLADTLGY